MRMSLSRYITLMSIQGYEIQESVPVSLTFADNIQARYNTRTEHASKHYRTKMKTKIKLGVPCTNRTGAFGSITESGRGVGELYFVFKTAQPKGGLYLYIRGNH